MSDDKTEDALSTEDEELVSEFGAENVDTDDPAPDAEPAPVETPDDEQEAEETSEDSEEFSEDHDADATLNEEEEKEELEEAPEEQTSQVEKSARILADKWDSLSDEQRATKVSNLFNNRKSGLEALAAELDTTSEALAQEYTEADEAEEEYLESDVLDNEEVREELKQELREELEPAFRHAEQQRFIAEVSKWGNHNKFTQEEISEITDLSGDVAIAFDDYVFDPATGDKLTFKERLRLALTSSDEVQNRLIDRKARKRADKIAAGVQAANLPSGGSGKTTTDLLGINDPEKFLEAANAASGARKW